MVSFLWRVLIQVTFSLISSVKTEESQGVMPSRHPCFADLLS